MIKKEVLGLINDQIKLEYESAFFYKVMSLDLAGKGWNGFAHWMHEQYREELEHAEEMVEYVLSRGEKPTLQNIEIGKLEGKDVVDYFKGVYDHECLVSTSIDKIVAEAVKQKDYATENFYRKYVDEQVEEEETTSNIIEKLKLAGSNAGYLVIDAQLAERK